MEHAHLFETSATILGIVSIGKLIESFSKRKTMAIVKELAEMKISNIILLDHN